MTELERANDKHQVWLKQLMPTLIKPGELDSSVSLPRLFVPKDLDIRIKEDLEFRKKYIGIYNDLMKKHKLMAKRKLNKENANILLEMHKEHIVEERRVGARELMNASFAEIMFQPHTCNNRQAKYGQIEQTTPEKNDHE